MATENQLTLSSHSVGVATLEFLFYAFLSGYSEAYSTVKPFFPCAEGQERVSFSWSFNQRRLIIVAHRASDHSFPPQMIHILPRVQFCRINFHSYTAYSGVVRLPGSRGLPGAVSSRIPVHLTATSDSDECSIAGLRRND